VIVVTGHSLEEIATAVMPSLGANSQSHAQGPLALREPPTFTTGSLLVNVARAWCDAEMLSSRLSFLLNALIACVTASTGYHEHLLLRPLPQSTLLASFNFLSNETQTAFEQQNFRYFPRSFGQILQHAHTKELHLRFSVGRWDADSWGQRPWNGAREGGTGVELWAWVEANNEEE
jgi:hypothetical protein